MEYCLATGQQRPLIAKCCPLGTVVSYGDLYVAHWSTVTIAERSRSRPIAERSRSRPIADTIKEW
jgi:hypothetical protein